MIRRLLVVTAVFLLGTGFLAHVTREERIPPRQTFESFPRSVAGWEGSPNQPLDAQTLDILKVDEYLIRTYLKRGALPIGLFIAYYQSQRQGDAIHSPQNCLPGAGWQAVSRRDLRIPIGDPVSATASTIVVNRYLIEKGVDRQLVLYWYQSQGRAIASEYESKARLIWSAIRSNRTDAALVRLVVPVPEVAAGEQRAEQSAVEFVKSMFSVLDQYLPS